MMPVKFPMRLTNYLSDPGGNRSGARHTDCALGLILSCAEAHAFLSAGQTMEDGQGVLADGTRYIRESGEDYGPNGFWKRWTRLAGVSAAGKVGQLRQPLACI